MSRLRQLLAIAAICGVVCGAATAQTGGLAAAQTAAKPAPTAAEVQVDLLRGLADIFSRGMDTLAEKLNRQGYSARVYSTNGWQTVARRIADKYTRGHKDIVVVIGHSLGANATFDIANALNSQKIPIELIVTYDATSPRPVPNNVLHFVNIYQENGFGKKVWPGPISKVSSPISISPPIPAFRTPRSKNRRGFTRWSCKRSPTSCKKTSNRRLRRASGKAKSRKTANKSSPPGSIQ